MSLSLLAGRTVLGDILVCIQDGQSHERKEVKRQDQTIFLSCQCCDMELTLCMLGNFTDGFSSSADFFFQNIFFFEKIFQECHQSVNQFGSRSGLTFCGA